MGERDCAAHIRLTGVINPSQLGESLEVEDLREVKQKVYHGSSGAYIERFAPFILWGMILLMVFTVRTNVPFLFFLNYGCRFIHRVQFSIP